MLTDAVCDGDIEEKTDKQKKLMVELAADESTAFGAVPGRDLSLVGTSSAAWSTARCSLGPLSNWPALSDGRTGEGDVGRFLMVLKVFCGCWSLSYDFGRRHGVR